MDLDYLRSVGQVDWLMDIRRMSFLPVIILTDTPEQDAGNMIHLGADMCISGKDSYSVIASHADAQLRRYTEYNYYDNPASMEFFHRPGAPNRGSMRAAGQSAAPRIFPAAVFHAEPPHRSDL